MTHWVTLIGVILVVWVTVVCLSVMFWGAVLAMTKANPEEVEEERQRVLKFYRKDGKDGVRL